MFLFIILKIIGGRSDITNFAEVVDKDFETQLKTVLNREASYAPAQEDLRTRIRDGGFALDKLLYRAGSLGASEQFSWERVLNGLVCNTTVHENQHVRDERSREPQRVLIEALSIEVLNPTREDQVEAEALREIGVRMESLRKAPAAFLLDLLGAWRGGFANLKEQDARTYGTGVAERDIMQAVLAELRERPDDYGLVIKRPSIKVGNLELSVDEQINAQLDCPAASAQYAEKLAGAVLKRARTDQRGKALLAKYEQRVPALLNILP
jgi:hypothetical protein